MDPWGGEDPTLWQPASVFLLENPIDRGARGRGAAVHRVARNQIRLMQLSMHTHVLCLLEINITL